MPYLRLTALAACAATAVRAAYPPQEVPSSWPHDYLGKPSGDFSPAWQTYFEVKDPLPNVTWPISRNFAGNLPVNRAGHPNNTLFFWAFEKENGSLTAKAHERSNHPWAIWLNGGPGSSSMLGLTSENGPIHINSDFSASQNNFSWDRLVDYFWVDQPVGVGFSTADSAGYVHDEDEMGRDFMNFLSNLVKVFPSLKTRPLYLTGESYAGTYIPYIMKTYFGLADPPVNIVKFAIGDGTISDDVTFAVMPTLTTIETYPQLIGYDSAVYEYFREQEHYCGYDLNLTYPQEGHFPTLEFIPGQNLGFSSLRSASRLDPTARAMRRQSLRAAVQLARRASKDQTQRSVPFVRKRDLSGRANGTLDPWYACDLDQELMDYANNFSFPWSNISRNGGNGFDADQVPNALDPEANMNAVFFFNDPKTRAALHAPTSKNWKSLILYPFLGDSTGEGLDPSIAPMAFFDDLATNATRKNVGVLLYSGNDDALVSHRGTEVAIQNTTFGGIQGFTRRPSTPWFDDNGQRGGVVHQERNWTYVLIEGAGHYVPYTKPRRAFILLREFILGNNQTGLVTMSDETVSVIGGESSSLAVDAIPGQLGIYEGSFSTTSTYTYPSATIAAWNRYIATATANTVTPGKAAVRGSSISTDNGATQTDTAIHMNRINGILLGCFLTLVMLWAGMA
ncbi:alpha/beta-hydrolase [Trametes coccinea BRFM310]|uniref:Carboxypeptidase n=1 Tax=Trametes coccinea (strain BRFM310) TaxID=1353009 RepID=A0A1Y2J5X5_TRAC3|nr:alpha/beta-hydrolase [Trametes coccinea BRFM310]